MPQVSVLTAAFQPDPGYLVDAYESLRTQSVDWQWVIQIDGTASDMTLVPPAVARDSRVSVAANGSRSGTAATRNLGLLRCDCDIVQVLDADDAFYPGALEDLAAAIEPVGVAMAFGQSHHFWSDGSQTRQWQPAPWPEGILPPGTIGDTWLRTGRHHVTLSASMWRAVYVHAVGGWAGLVGMQDVSLMMAVTEEHPAAYVDRAVLRSRVHEAQSSTRPPWTRRELQHRALVASRVIALRSLRGHPTPDPAGLRSPQGDPLPMPRCLPDRPDS